LELFNPPSPFIFSPQFHFSQKINLTFRLTVTSSLDFRTFPTAMGKIAKIEYFRVPPRWLFVKITDEAGNVGWGEASLEGHTQAVEGCLDAWIDRYTGMEAE
jgi:hypothetical protein